MGETPLYIDMPAETTIATIDEKSAVYSCHQIIKVIFNRQMFQLIFHANANSEKFGLNMVTSEPQFTPHGNRKQYRG